MSAASSAHDGSPTTQCPDCTGVVSVRAATCPHCGAPLKAAAGIYPDPETGRGRYWNGNEWGSPTPSMNTRALVAGGLGLGLFLVEPFLYQILGRLIRNYTLTAVVMVGLAAFTIFWGVKALREAKQNDEQGKGFAIAGIACGAVWVLISLVLLIGIGTF